MCITVLVSQYNEIFTNYSKTDGHCELQLNFCVKSPITHSCLQRNVYRIMQVCLKGKIYTQTVLVSQYNKILKKYFRTEGHPELQLHFCIKFSINTHVCSVMCTELCRCAREGKFILRLFQYHNTTKFSKIILEQMGILNCSCTLASNFQ